MSCSSVTRSRMRGRSSSRPTMSAMRSPEMIIPRMIATPKTTNCDAAESPSTLSIWLRIVTKNAATQVDAGLASPPDSAAPPRTTAATGPSRYGRTGIDPRIDDDAADEDAGEPGSARRRRRRRTRHGSARGSRPCAAARRLAPTDWNRRPAAVDRSATLTASISTSTSQNSLLMPRNLSRHEIGQRLRHRRVVGDADPVLVGDPEQDQPRRQGDDERVELEHGDEQAVDEADDHGAHEDDERGVSEAVVLTLRNADEDVGEQRDRRRHRQVDPADHDRRASGRGRRGRRRCRAGAGCSTTSRRGSTGRRSGRR